MKKIQSLHRKNESGQEAVNDWGLALMMVRMNCQ